MARVVAVALTLSRSSLDSLTLFMIIGATKITGITPSQMKLQIGSTGSPLPLPSSPPPYELRCHEELLLLLLLHDERLEDEDDDPELRELLDPLDDEPPPHVRCGMTFSYDQ